MSLEQNLQLHKQERDNLKAQIYDAQRRLIELDGVIAALEVARSIAEKEKIKADEIE